MFVCYVCCVLSGRGLCDGLITRPEESYRLWRVVVCDQETSNNEEAKARYRAVENTTTLGCNSRRTNNKHDFHNRSSSIINVQQFLRPQSVIPSNTHCLAKTN
jgi:hypothetical protein